MNQEEYKRISYKLNSNDDIARVAREYGMEEELALIIYTQRITRDATRNFYVVKNQISRIASQFDRGAPLVQLAGRQGFPPVLLAYLLFMHKGLPRKQFWKYVRSPDGIRDPRLKKEIKAAVEADIIYSPRGEEIQRERGHTGERRLFEWLDRRGISYMTERDLKKLKEQYVKTPDVLFMKPMMINGKKVSWIESKANFGDIVEIRRNLKKQLIPYVKLFGDGIVVYWFGYVSDIQPPEGITLVNAGFFREAHPPPRHPPEHREHTPIQVVHHHHPREGETPPAPPQPLNEEYYGE